MKIEIKYNKKADTIYLQFSDEKAAYSKGLDRERTVDYSEHGEIRGIKFLSVRSGVKTDDLPHRSAIVSALYDKGIVNLADKQGNVSVASDFQPDAGNLGEAPLRAPMKARIIIVMRASVAMLIFIGLIVVDVILSRNMFVLSSLTGLVASLIGLVVVMFPTVAACFILLAVVLDTYSRQTSL